MGLYDTISWLAPLPDAPAGLNYFLLGFQTKDIPEARQRLLEVSKDGLLEHREYIGKGFRYTEYSPELLAEMHNQIARRKLRAEKGVGLPEDEYTRIPLRHTGTCKLLASYGEPNNGRLEYLVDFTHGKVVSVEQTSHIPPNRDAYQKRVDALMKTGRMTQYIIKSTDGSEQIILLSQDKSRKEKEE